MIKSSIQKLLLSGAAAALTALTISPLALADEPGTDARCYDAANAKTAGQADWKGCAGMYIVKDLSQLKSMLSTGVTHEGIDYTVGDSAHNVFTGQVASMTNLYKFLRGYNPDIGYWDTSNVQTFRNMFNNAFDFNQDISGWNTSKATDMQSMFFAARSFNQDIGDWDTSKVRSMNNIFYNAYSFNQDISGWNVNNIPSKPRTFGFATPDAWTDDKQPVWGTDGSKPVAATKAQGPATQTRTTKDDVADWDRAVKAGAPFPTIIPGWTYDMYMNAEPSDAETATAEQFIVPGSVFPVAGELSLVQGQKYPSPTGSHYLIFQDNGNVVVYTIDDKVVWGLNEVTNKYGSIAKVVQQADGNFAAYDKNNGWIWSARSAVSPAGTKLHLDTSGALKLVGPDGAALWSSQ